MIRGFHQRLLRERRHIYSSRGMHCHSASYMTSSLSARAPPGPWSLPG
ncbi:hypothetical protein I549_0916 [Mycobacterium avium subsp. avium 2285 (R)]|nr:hypothetical protein I549_0916 [Mycobacterium avium subsp. avium 2285 (R)]